PDAGLLPDLLAEVVQLGPAHPAAAQDLDLLDPRRMDGKCPFHADAVRDPPDGERLAQATAAAPDHDSFERLEPVAPALRDLDVHAHGVAGPKGGDCRLDVVALNRGQTLHDSAPPSQSRLPIITRSSSRSQERVAARSVALGAQLDQQCPHLFVERGLVEQVWTPAEG